MAANVLPFILAAGAAAVLLGKKRKKKRKDAPGMGYVPADIPPPPKPPAKAPADAPVPSEIWKQRQTALAYLGGLGICDCNPGLPDGIYGKNTRNAILGFQTYANIGRTGKWDAPTDTMMKRALEMAAKGMVKVPKAEAKGEVEKKTSESKDFVFEIKIVDGSGMNVSGQTINIGRHWPFYLAPWLNEQWDTSFKGAIPVSWANDLNGWGFIYERTLGIKNGEFIKATITFDKEDNYQKILNATIKIILDHLNLTGASDRAVGNLRSTVDGHLERWTKIKLYTEWAAQNTNIVL